MKLSFHGACLEVTGSCYLVQTASSRFLVDCGMFQGSRFAGDENAAPFSFDPKIIDFIILTHSHIDHCGRLAKLYKEGFRGQVYATAATRELTELMLIDSARVILEEAMELGRQPFYSADDVGAVMKKFITLKYHQEKNITPEITVKFYDAGHILGSAFVELKIKDGLKTKRLVFSGDLGNPPQPIVEDTEFIASADVVIIESTYGGRIHEPAEMRLQLLQKAVLESVGRGGTLMVPIFALERTQEVLYELNKLVESRQLPSIPMFLDSPLAIRATGIYRHYTNLYDAEAKARLAAGDDLFNFPGLKMTPSREESKTINHYRGAKVVMAGSGMCTGGRIGYHLKFNLPDPKSHLLIISYQAVGSLGRKLLEGAREVFVAGEKVRVRAKVSAIGAYSSHADQPKLLHWVKMMSGKKPKIIFVVHGEQKASQMLAAGLKEKLGLDSIIPEPIKEYEI